MVADTFQVAVRSGTIVGEATRTVSAFAQVLGYVLAHEIGHMLLPEYSHVPAGLMQPSVPRWIAEVPAFLPAQAATLRTILTTAN